MLAEEAERAKKPKRIIVAVLVTSRIRMNNENRSL
jgi:hypothetical protein